MAGNLSDGTTVILSSLSVGGLNQNGVLFGNIVGKEISALSGLATSAFTATGKIAFTASPTFSSGVSASAGTFGTVLAQGGAIFSGVTADFRTNSVIPSSITYAGGASISGLTIGQWGFVFNASGLSIVYSSGKSAYFFGGSTLSAAIT